MAVAYIEALDAYIIIINTTSIWIQKQQKD